MERLVLSQNGRLMLSLLELDRFRDSAEVPMALSQEGIARSLRTQVHNISRALSSLEADGLVTDRLAHVRGAPRRRRAYFLTDKGRRTAEPLRESLLKERVNWEQGGTVKEMPIADVMRLAASATGRTPSILEVVDLAREGGAITPSSFSDRLEGAEKPSVVRQSIGRPKVERFFGRSEALAEITDALSGDSISTLLVHGMPGIGKSTLLSKVFDELNGDQSLFWYTFSSWDSDRSFADQIASFLSSSGRRSLSRALKSGTSVSDLYPPLLSDLGGLNAVIFLDDVHKASDKLEFLVSMLVDASRMSRSMKLVLISRTVPRYVPKDIRQSLHMELTDLDRESARRLVDSSAENAGDDILRWAHGNPLLLNLIAKKGSAAERRDVIGFIDSEIYSTLTDSQRDVLELLSVFRHPVPLSALSEEDHEEAFALREMSLVSDQESGIWVHDLLRDYFSSRLNAGRKARAHLKAAKYCSSRPEPEWRLEALFHMVESGEWADAAAFTVSNSDGLSRDFPEETVALVGRIQEEAVGAETLPMLLYARANLAEVAGNIEEALSDYERCSALMTSQDPLRPLALESLARLQADNAQWARSLEVHEEARSLYEKSGDVDGQVREWLNLGMMFKQRGDLPHARECYSKALSLAARAENRSAQAACMNNLALTYWQMSAPGDAERMFRESIRLSHAAGDHMGEGRALENFSQFCRGYLRVDEATNLLMEASTAYAHAGDLAESKRTRAMCSEAMAAQGDLEGAISLCRSALTDPSLRRRRGLFQERSTLDSGDQFLMLALVSHLRLSGEYDDARDELQKLTDEADRSDDIILKAKTKLEAALIAESSGDLTSASAILLEAEELLAREANREGLAAVYLRQGIVAEKSGDLKGASAHYENAARQAELAGNTKARTIAEEWLESVTGSTRSSGA